MPSAAGTPFGLWLKRRREDLDLTQGELADAVGCSRITIQKIEAGDRRPSKQLAELLASHLKIPRDEHAAFTRFARSEGMAPAGAPSTAAPGDFPWRPSRRTNLPAPLTRIIGREDELEAIVLRFLKEDVRLLTLTGAPGIGKTRLAIQVGTAMLDAFDDGICFVPLAAVTDPGRVAFEIGRALGLSLPDDGSPLEVVTGELEHRALLLILDNFEHLLPAAAAVREVLQACRNVSALVTSREALGLRGEYLFDVPPLLTPDPGDLPHADSLADYPAVALFVDRARARSRDFGLTAANGGMVAEICARLDGLPLAIELAASRVSQLGLEALLSGMAGRLDLASAEFRDEPDRHQTLRNAVAWSYDLLGFSERRFFERVGVFVGGCTPEAVDAVCGEGSGDDALTTLRQLEAKSLIRRDHDGRRNRVVLLETLREFALERLALRGQEAATRRRHAEFYAGFAEARESDLLGPRQREAIDLVESDLENLRGALGWAIAEREAELGLRLSAALSRFWYMRGYLVEGRAWLASALALRGGADGLRARAALGGGRLAEEQGDYDEARRLYQTSLELARSAGDRQALANALSNLGALASHQGDLALAQRLHSECLTIRRELGDRRGQSASLTNLGFVAANLGRLDEAWLRYQDALEIDRALGDLHGQAILLSNLGATSHDMGRHDRALDLHEQALTLRRDLGDRSGIARSLNHRGVAACNLGDFGHGRVSFLESLHLRLDLGDRKGMADCLELIAWTDAAAGEAVRAARLLGSAQALRERLGAPLQPSERKDYEQAVSLARSQLGDEAFEAALQEGRSADPESELPALLGPDWQPHPRSLE